MKCKAASSVSSLAVYVALVTVVAPSASAVVKNFCKSPSTNPFARPLEQLPSLANPPEGVGLAFAPSLRLRSVGGPLAPKGAEIGYVLSNSVITDRKNTRRPWVVVSTLSRLRGPSHERHIITRTVRLMHSYERKARLTFNTYKKHRGTYRIDLVFRHPGGGKHGHYSKYVRILPAITKARLALRRRKVTPEQQITVRLENPGTVHIGAGYGYRVEQLTEGTWRTAAFRDDRVVPRVLVLVGPLSTFDCAAISVPQNQPSGRYRVIKDIWGRVGHGGVRRKTSASAEFDVE